ncbi:embryogenesis-associated protein EMB8 [Selaginella moellendorffii]|nr:embryogenesis-associated protein EMB8 [Selaginella moellendorffii]|eukprot:XP_002971512.2 embryogenesis-associated protein EMB8 [Selaginella moellendorffii]
MEAYSRGFASLACSSLPRNLSSARAPPFHSSADSFLRSRISFVLFSRGRRGGVGRQPLRTLFMAPRDDLEIVSGDGELRSEILHNMPTVKRRKYRAFPVIGSNRHVETVFAAFYRHRPKMRFRRECLRMIDGGTVALDWPVMGEDRDAAKWREKLPSDAPVLIFLPGLTGGSHDSYVKYLVSRVRNIGWHTVVFNSRGCSDSPVTSPKFYSASFTEDLRQVVRFVAYRFPESRIYAVGWSLGANILVRYLGQEGENCILSGAVSLCNPFDLVVADEDFRKGFNNIYDKSLATSLRTIFRKHAALFEEIGGEYNIPLAANAKTVRQFDEGLTRVSFGYRSVDEYYADASSSKSIEHVKVPLFCIQAANDPIAPNRAIPRAAIKENRNCLLVVTPKGGHLGWVAGQNAPFGNPWTDTVVVEYLEAVESLYRDRKSIQREQVSRKEDDHVEIACAT